MIITIRLYRQHDLDLIGLYLKYKNKFSSLIREALVSYVGNNEFEIEVPKDFRLNSKLEKIYRINIHLGEKNEDAIKWLGNIKPGYRNAMLKNIMRSYLKEPNTYIYIRNTVPIAKETAMKYNEVDKISDIVLEKKVKAEKSNEQLIKKEAVKKDFVEDKSVMVDIVKKEKTIKPEIEIEPSTKQEHETNENLIDMFDQMMSNF